VVEDRARARGCGMLMASESALQLNSRYVRPTRERKRVRFDGDESASLVLRGRGAAARA